MISSTTVIKAISFKAGDVAILAATDEMLVLRIVGDEFTLIISMFSIKAAQELVDQVLAQNDQPILHEEQELPLALWCGKQKYLSCSSTMSFSVTCIRD